ncbi:MAG: hypothetical protein K6B45_08225 [Bacteroidaceae bacterium]|nr:hypothetical protein [Bacteroidaceae bacterium]
MKKSKRIFLLKMALLVMVAVGLSSCRHADVHDALLRAEALMETDPHAARAVLDSIASPNLNRLFTPLNPPVIGGQKPLKGRASDSSGLPSFRRGKGEAALFALLKTQADYKCDIPLTSDSLPLIATDYYGTKRKSQRAALAQHYLGCTYIEMHRDLDAIEAQLRATTLFPDTTNKYFAHSLLHLGCLYSRHYMVDSAWVAFERYRRTESCNSDSANVSYADYYMGTVAFYKDNDEFTDSLFQSVLSNKKTNNNIRFNTYFQLAKLRFYHQHDIEGALAYLNKLGNRFGEDNGALLTLRADILAQQRQPATSYELYKKALRNSSDIYVQCMSYEGLASVAPLLNKPDSTRFFIDQYKGLLDSIYTMNKQREITEIKDKHIVDLHDQRQKARNMRWRLWGVVLLSAFIITLLLIERKRKNERLRFEQELNAIKQRQIDQKVNDEEEQNGEETNPAEESPFIHPFAIQQERVKLYRKQYAASRWKNYLSDHSLDILSKEKVMPAKEMNEFNAYLHGLFADLFMDLLNSNARVSHLALEFVAMKLLGFDTEHIAYCSRSNVHAVHNRRYYLKEKLTPEWYSFVMGEYSK